MSRIPAIDKDDCIGCEVCAHSCPEVFEMQENEKAGVHNPTGAPEEKIEEAMDNCPAACIYWEE